MKYALLEFLKSSDGFVSGAKIGRELGVSRAAVWKAIEALRKDGCVIEAVTNKGYRIVDAGHFTAADILGELKTEAFGKNLKLLRTVTSTNDKLRDLALEGAREGTCVVALKQTAGRGRRGRSWESGENDGLYFAVLTRPELLPDKASVITLIAGLSVCRALRNMGVNALIKWPNDVLVNGKKICGILSEMDAEGYNINHVITGIGINTDIENFDSELKDIATSVRLETGKLTDKTKLLTDTLFEFEKNYYGYLENGFGKFREEYKALCCIIDKDVYIIGGETYEARVCDIAEDGALIVKTDNGRKRNVYSGEVSVRL